MAAIGTLGFRGEALAAIAAVSPGGYLLPADRRGLRRRRCTWRAACPAGASEAGCPEGTTICVRDLFYNTPARMKFMKKDTAEARRRRPAS